MGQPLIQLTATGNYYEATINAFADFLGYQELVHFPNGSEPNPMTRQEYVCEHIKKVIAEDIARMPIASKVQEIQAEHQNIEEVIKTEILEGITVVGITLN